MRTKKSKVNGPSNTIFYCYPGFLAFCFLIFLGCGDTWQINSAGFQSAGVDELVPQALRIIQKGLSDDDPRIRVKAVEKYSQCPLLLFAMKSSIGSMFGYRKTQT